MSPVMDTLTEDSMIHSLPAPFPVLSFIIIFSLRILQFSMEIFFLLECWILAQKPYPTPELGSPDHQQLSPRKDRRLWQGCTERWGDPAEVGKKLQNVFKILYSTSNPLNCQSSSLCAVDDALII